MSTYEGGVWMWRLIVIIMVSIVIVLIVSLGLPRLDNTELHANVVTARIAFNGGFQETPGVVQLEKFTQTTADEFLIYPADQVTRIGVQAWLMVPDDEYYNGFTQVGEKIIYNKPGYTFLSAPTRAGLTGTDQDQEILPVVIEDANGERRNGFLHLEVLYEN